MPLTVVVQIAVSGALMGLVYALIAYGFQLTYATSKSLNFGQGELVMVSAFVSLTLLGTGLPYVVVLPLRRGFGATGGDYAEDPGPCSNPDFRKAENAASQDVMAAYDYARTLPYVDGSRMILAGQSAGAMVSIFTAAMRAPQGLVAVLGFAAGRGGNPEYRPGVPCAVESVAKLLDTLGKQIKVPVLFHYAQNDRYFNPATTKLWYDRFTAGGARADYVMQPAFGTDGHYVFSAEGGAKIWLPAVEHFLKEYGVPFQTMPPSARPVFAGTAQ